jgi:hypothetical protein
VVEAQKEVLLGLTASTALKGRDGVASGAKGVHER